jgi:hypothetical protein
MATMPFEEKYPIDRIQKCVKRIEEIITERIFPNFRLYKTPNDIYKYYSNLLNTKKEDNVGWDYLKIMKLVSKLSNNNLSEKGKFSQYHFEQMSNHPYIIKTGGVETLEDRINAYKFNEIKVKGNRAPEYKTIPLPSSPFLRLLHSALFSTSKLLLKVHLHSY